MLSRLHKCRGCKQSTILARKPVHNLVAVAAVRGPNMLDRRAAWNIGSASEEKSRAAFCNAQQFRLRSAGQAYLDNLIGNDHPHAILFFKNFVKRCARVESFQQIRAE